MDWLTTTRFAHRGLHDIAAGAPENSCAAFDGAAHAGYGMELDARLSADGVPVVFHDSTLDGLTDQNGAVNSRTAAELGRAKILGTLETIPRLRDVLELVGGRTPVLVEIKSHNQPVGPLEAAVAGVIADCAGTCGILSFNPHSVRWFRDNAPQVPRGRSIIGLWASSGGMPFWRRLGLRISAAMVPCDPDFLAYDLPALPARNRRLPILAWTVRTPEQQSAAEKNAASYIFEDMRP